MRVSKNDQMIVIFQSVINDSVGVDGKEELYEQL